MTVRKLMLLVTFSLATAQMAQCQNLVPKWSQPYEAEIGENIPSDLDWRQVGLPRDQRESETWMVADDFVSDGRAITAVRWWGSYFDESFLPEPSQNDEFRPVIEDAYLLSFFRHDGSGEPMDLLASYIADIDDVSVKSTGDFGADGHLIWEYEVALSRTHLDHADDELAAPHAFLEVEDDQYWLSIAAENGHEMEEATWTFFDNGDDVLTQHFWGWHTSPAQELEPAVMGNLDMFDIDWDYNDWGPIEPEHGLENMAFELLTPVGDCNGDGFVDAADLACACASGVVGDVLMAIGWGPGRGFGDFDGSGAVSFPDFLTLAANFGSPGTFVDGDCNCDGTVNFADFLKLVTNFNTVAPAEEFRASVPEPSGSFIAMICLLLSAARRRRT